MRIYVFGTRGFPNIQGGVEIHCENLYTNMSEDKQIVVFRRKSFLSSKPAPHYKNITFIDLPSTKIKGVEAFLHSFFCSIWCIFSRPDIIHIHNIGPGIFTPLLRLFGLKVVVTYHSPNYEHKKWGKFARNILKSGEVFATRTANFLLFVNKTVIDKFSEKIRSKSLFIPNGINKLPIAESSDYIESLSLKRHKYILTVGRITQEKGFDYLIEAFLKTSMPLDYKLVIAGGIDHASEYSKQLLSQADQNKIIFAGFVDGERLRQLYSFAGLFVLPSYNEGYPLVLIEAINYNLPILASDITANKQIGLPSESYFPVGNTLELTNKLMTSLEKDFERVHYSINLYSWEEIAKQVETIYEKVVYKS